MRSSLVWVSVAVAFVLGACGPKVGADEEGEGSGSESGDETSATAETSTTPTTTSPSTSTSTSTTTNGTFPDSGEVDVDSGVMLDVNPFFCDVPNFFCSEPLDCMQWNCGAIESPVDENGCLRRSCGTDGDCLDGEVCFTPQDWGFCVSSGTYCEDDPGTGVCQCTSDPDCGGSHCIPADQAPPQHCDHESADECADGGCEGVMGRPIIPAGQSCVCDLDEPFCLWWPEGAPVEDAPTVYMRVEDQFVAVFPFAVDPAPLGWIACDDLAFPPPACICAENLPCAMG